MSEERLIKWQQRYGGWLEPGEQVRAAVFGSTVASWAAEGLGGLLLMPYLIDKGRIVLLSDRRLYVLQARFFSPKAKAVRAKFPIGGYRARRSGGDFNAKLVIGGEDLLSAARCGNA